MFIFSEINVFGYPDPTNCFVMWLSSLCTSFMCVGLVWVIALRIKPISVPIFHCVGPNSEYGRTTVDDVFLRYTCVNASVVFQLMLKSRKGKKL